MEVKTHLDPKADRLGVKGCCCRSCELARKRKDDKKFEREYRKAFTPNKHGEYA